MNTVRGRQVDGCEELHQCPANSSGSHYVDMRTHTHMHANTHSNLQQHSWSCIHRQCVRMYMCVHVYVCVTMHALGMSATVHSTTGAQR